MGWDLKIGEIKEHYVTYEDIWCALNNFYFRSSVTMSYKFGLLKSLIENLYNLNENLELHFDKLFYSFTKIYWNLVVHHNLWQSNNKSQTSSIQRVLEKYSIQYKVPIQISFDKLPDDLQLKIINDVKKVGKKYVIGAFYSDTNGIFYEFNIKSEYLKFNPPVYQFLQRHQRIITALTNYHLAKFLESNNSATDVNNLLKNVEAISKRESLDQYLLILKKYEDNKCFYCGKTLDDERRTTHVDHFIPWSFIQNDNLWNLVAACQKCNLQKNDRLADKYYLDELVHRNECLSNVIDPTEQKWFEEYKEEKLVQLYDYSMLNGFTDIWKPRAI